MTSAADWWVMFITNRLFEAELAYLIGCAIYRLYRRRQREKRSRLVRRASFLQLAA